MSGAKQCFAFRASLRCSKYVYVNNIIDNIPNKHMVEQNYHMLKMVLPNLKVYDLESSMWGVKKNSKNGLLKVSISLGASCNSRHWSIRNYAILLHKLYDIKKFELILIGAANDKPFFNDFIKEINIIYEDCVGKIGIFDTIKKLKESSLHFGNDSGPIHMAAAAGVPVVEFTSHSHRSLDFGSPVYFYPYGVPYLICQPDEQLETCESGCQKRYPHCINEIDRNKAIEDSTKFYMRLLT